MRTITASSPVLLCVTLLSAQPLFAYRTSVVADPEGDASFNLSTDARPFDAPGYLDIVRAEITLMGSIFVVTMDLAAPLPDNPPLRQGAKICVWNWELDTNPTTFPAGHPLPPGFSSGAELVLGVRWDGRQFNGALIDRRPLLTGQEAVELAAPMNIDGDRVTIYLSRFVATVSTFHWTAATYVEFARGGAMGISLVDIAPDLGQATWSSTSSAGGGRCGMPRCPRR